MRYLTALLLTMCSLSVYAGENLFYILHSNNNPKQLQNLQATLQTIKDHHQSINIVVTQAYQINSKGDVTGFINPETRAVTKANSIKLMAMITNSNFDQAKAHAFLSSPSAQDKALAFILAACQAQQLHGVQFDFEMISVKDKTALTAFFKKAAALLHKNGYAVSFAVVPALADTAGPSAFLQKTHENWSGAYDLARLGEYADFITIMAYNQHPDGTTPGPGASIRWVRESVKYTLKYIPATKLSLGIPAYSLYWYTGGNKHVATHRYEISHADANKLISKNHARMTWHAKDKVNYVVYERNWLNEYIYLEDAQSFQAKLALIKQFGLRGASVFRIGTEDKKIWTVFSHSLATTQEPLVRVTKEKKSRYLTQPKKAYDYEFALHQAREQAPDV